MTQQQAVALEAPQLDLDALAGELEGRHPAEILEWAFAQTGRMVIACSFQKGGLALAWMARRIIRPVPVLFVQTGYHFPETIAFRDRIVSEWGLDLVETRPAPAPVGDPEPYRSDPDACCYANKVVPLQRRLEALDGWITGARRDQSDVRRFLPVVQRQRLDSGREIWKINPLAGWTAADVDAYVRANRLPEHPLYAGGYRSIGCAPCTRRTQPGEDDRAGRWAGSDKTECGLQTFGLGPATAV